MFIGDLQNCADHVGFDRPGLVWVAGFWNFCHGPKFCSKLDMVNKFDVVCTSGIFWNTHDVVLANIAVAQRCSVRHVGPKYNCMRR